VSDAPVDDTTFEDFWSRGQPGFRFSKAEVGTLEFFREVEEHRYALEPHIPEVVDFPGWRDRDVLDAGCGIATDGLQFARGGARYTGLDASPVAIDLARKRFELETECGDFVIGSVTELPFPAETFDLVYSHGVIHHVPDTQRAVDEFHRVLRPGGTALVMLYHRGSLNYRFTIMVVRRALATGLLLPGMSSAVARLTGESLELLDAHRQLLKSHGPRYLTDASLFLSKNTDGPENPLSKAYSRRQACELFGRFNEVRTEARFLNLRIYPGGERLSRTRLARLLESRWGWHLYVRAAR
jgi:SAM-dependent methyltransferase